MYGDLIESLQGGEVVFDRSLAQMRGFRNKVNTIVGNYKASKTIEVPHIEEYSDQ